MRVHLVTVALKGLPIAADKYNSCMCRMVLG